MTKEIKRPFEMIASTQVPVVAMVIFEGKLIVATQEGVFMKDENDNFRELEFIKLEDANDQP